MAIMPEQEKLTKAIKGLEDVLFQEELVFQSSEDSIEAAIALLKAQVPETAEVKWQERHRKSYRQYTGFDSTGEEHTVTVCVESEGKEPYCGKCSAQLAESFTNFCPRCGTKLIMTPPCPAEEQTEAAAWQN